MLSFKSILNRVHPLRSFVYKSDRWLNEEEGHLAIAVDVAPRANSRPICSGCNQKGPGYDTLPARMFQFIPLLGIAVFFVYAMRRVNCPTCGVKVETVPWAHGKSRLTIAYSWFLARWAKRLSWQEVANIFHTSWNTVFRAVEMAVEWGRQHMDLSGITAAGVDEIQVHCGHHYLTLVYQIDKTCRRLLWAGEDRQEATLRGFFNWFGEARTAQLKFICSDMWKPYLQVIAEKASQAIHVLDRFHIMKMLNKAIDEIRAGEARQMARDGYVPHLKHSRWCLLKRPENLTERQEAKLKDLLQYNLRSVRAYLLKEDFQGLWGYVSASWAGKFIDRWTTRVMRSRLEPMKKVAKTVRRHKDLILNWFRAHGEISSGIVEGLNNNAKVTMRKARGYRTSRVAIISLYHALGRLPEPEDTHRFC